MKHYDSVVYFVILIKDYVEQFCQTLLLVCMARITNRTQTPEVGISAGENQVVRRLNQSGYLYATQRS